MILVSILHLREGDTLRHLGAAIGSKSFINDYMKEKVTQWVNEVNQLATIAATHPQASYAAFTHSSINKWTYFMRTIPP